MASIFKSLTRKIILKAKTGLLIFEFMAIGMLNTKYSTKNIVSYLWYLTSAQSLENYNQLDTAMSN